MGIEISCGAVLYSRTKQGIRYLLLFQNGSRTWSFPKGHMESGETKEQTALREVFEETGMKIALFSEFMESVSYPVKNGNTKQVTLFLAEAAGEITARKDEIGEYIWAEKEEAIRLLPKVGYDKLLDKAERILCGEEFYFLKSEIL